MSNFCEAHSHIHSNSDDDTNSTSDMEDARDFDDVGLESAFNQNVELNEQDINIPQNSNFITTKDLELSKKCKEKGNTYFREKQYDDAINEYTLAIDYCPEEDNQSLSVYFGNRSAAYFALDDFELTIEDCSSAISRDDKYTKVYSRRSQAYEKLDKLDESIAGTNIINCSYSYISINLLNYSYFQI